MIQTFTQSRCFMGRPTKYTPDRADKILNGLRTAMSFKAACACAGIEFHTFLRWRQRFARFDTAVRQAVAEAEARYVDIVATAACGYDTVETTTTTSPDGSVTIREVRSHKFHPQYALEVL